RVDGKIVSATVSTVIQRDSRDTESTVSNTTLKYRANIRYVYTVAQRDFTSAAITLGWSPLYGSAEDAQAITARYPVGAHVDVYYDPGNPDAAVLQRGMKEGTLSPLILATMFGIGSAAFFWAFATMHVS
ncbi:MAG: DUF3592 domain-containing protein, partial [Ancalomicrobiaceae bacterium]|nr:DUF3592 domain-containing protein [Ancalomicrobiaceae bacterium]